MIMAVNIKPMKQETLMAPLMTSASPNQRTFNRLIARMRTRLTVMTTAGVSSVQKDTTMAAAETSEAMAMA